MKTYQEKWGGMWREAIGSSDNYDSGPHNGEELNFNSVSEDLVLGPYSSI